MYKRVLIPVLLALALLSGSILPGVVPATPAAAQVTGSVLLAVGDIGNCSNTAGATATAHLIGGNTGTVATLGDADGSDISLAQYQQCYGPRWGQYLSRTSPAPGNRDLEVTGTTGYYNYFGAAAGPTGLGYYCYDLGTWHIVVLNSSCGRVPGGCDATSAQGKWLTADLAANPNTCTLAYWHRPLFTSGAVNPGAGTMRQLFQILYDHHADVVLNAHNLQYAGAEIVLNGDTHNYERFAPQTPNGAADPAHGIREWVVGTGGRTTPSVPSSPTARSATAPPSGCSNSR
jgi:hypothetical protein